MNELLEKRVSFAGWWFPEDLGITEPRPLLSGDFRQKAGTGASTETLAIKKKKKRRKEGQTWEKEVYTRAEREKEGGGCEWAGSKKSPLYSAHSHQTLLFVEETVHPTAPRGPCSSPHAHVMALMRCHLLPSKSCCNMITPLGKALFCLWNYWMQALFLAMHWGGWSQSDFGAWRKERRRPTSEKFPYGKLSNGK